METHQIKMQPLLRALVRKLEDDVFEGTVVELQIVVSGKTQDEVCEEIEHAILASYHAAIHINQSPFLDLLREQRDAVGIAWSHETKSSVRKMMLPDDVIRALSIAVKSPKINATVEFCYNNAA